MSVYIVCYSNIKLESNFCVLGVVTDFELASEIIHRIAEGIGKDMEQALFSYDMYTDGNNRVWFDEMGVADNVERADEWASFIRSVYM